MAQPRKFGKAEVEVSIRNRVGQGLKAIEKRMQSFAKNVRTIGVGVTAIGAGISGAGAAILGPMVGAIQQFAAAGDALDKMSLRTGVTVEALAELGFAAEQGGTNLETVERGLRGMSRYLMQARMGSSAAQQALGQLNLRIEDLDSLSPEQQFTRIAEALSGVEDTSRRAALAQMVFSEAGAQLLPMLNGLSDVREEARELGLILDGDATTAAAQLTDALNRIRRTMGGAFLQLGAALVEPTLRVLQVITDITKSVNHWIANNHALVRTIAAVAAGVLAVGTVITAVGTVFIFTGLAVSGFLATVAAIGSIGSAAVAALVSVFTFLISPIGIVTAVILALTGHISYMAVTSTDALSHLTDVFGVFGDTAKSAWEGIVDAISSGNLQLAGEIAFTALQIGWLTLTDRMTAAWDEVVFFLKRVWLGAVKMIVDAGAAIYFGVAKYFDMLSTALINGFDVAFVYIRGALDQIVTAIRSAIVEAQRFFGYFSDDQAAAVQAELDRDLAARGAARQSGLGSRMGDRAAGMSDRAAARQATQQQFGDIIGDMLTPQRTQRDQSQREAAARRMADLQAQLSNSVAQARDEANRPGGSAGGRGFAGLFQMQQQAGQMASRTSAIGTSSAAAVAAGALGVPMRPMEDTAKNTAKTAQLLQQIARQNRNMGFT